MTESRQFGVRANDENFLLITNNGMELSQLQVCALLNELTDENEQLKKVIDEADDLIKSHLTNHYIRKWKNICDYYGVDIE